MFIKASYIVESQSDFLNKINVFPVPDGDTGSNMSGTLRGVRKALQESAFQTFEDLGKIISKSSMLSSRGNSGTLISQFFIGFCSDFATIKSFNSASLDRSLQIGLENAYRSFEEPRHGTALDILEVAAKISKKLQFETDDLRQILSEIVNAAEAALEHTREVLPEMKEAKVVDSGASGFVDILKGFLAGATNAEVEIVDITESIEQIVYSDKNLDFRYCTELIISEVIVNDQSIREKVKPLGEYVQVVTVDKYIKLHIHTNEPQKVREICLRYGQEESFKADDMLEMVKNNLEKNHSPFQSAVMIESTDTNPNSKPKQKLLIITDSSIDIPLPWSVQTPLKILSIPIFESKSETDISEIYSPEEFYQKMENESDFSTKTSKISVNTYHEAFTKCLEMAENVVCLPLSSGISGSYESAKLAHQMLPEADRSKVMVYDTQTSSAGLAFLAQAAIKVISSGASLLETEQYLNQIKQKIQMYFLVENVKYLERGGRISHTASQIGQFLKLQPLLTLESGKIKASSEKLIFSNDRKRLKLLLKKLNNYLKENELQDLIIPFAGKNTRHLAEKLKFELIQKYDIKSDQIHLINLNLVVGSHTGPGTIAIIYL
ncbi:MAG: DegV family protein [Patescibacteria group bacterium]